MYFEYRYYIFIVISILCRGNILISHKSGSFIVYKLLSILHFAGSHVFPLKLSHIKAYQIGLVKISIIIWKNIPFVFQAK